MHASKPPTCMFNMQILVIGAKATCRPSTICCMYASKAKLVQDSHLSFADANSSDAKVYYLGIVTIGYWYSIKKHTSSWCLLLSARERFCL